MEKTKLDGLYEKVYFKILNFVSYRQRSEKEISDRFSKYLAKYRLSPEEREELKSKVYFNLEQDGYIDDVSFASTYIKGIVDSKKSLSKIKIYQFLLKKGIPKDTIGELLSLLPEDFIEQSVMKDAQKKLKTLRVGDVFTKKRKLSTYLFRKGYPSDVIRSVVDSLL
jgi:SOS response regulatory protein OraA/RecX